MSNLPTLDERRAALRMRIRAILDKAIAEGRIRVPVPPMNHDGATS